MPFTKLLLLMAACVMIASAAHGAVINVCSSGSPYTTIQDGVNAAGPGDTVKICPGTYQESVVVNGSGVRIRGNGPLGSVRLTCADPNGIGLWIRHGANNRVEMLDISLCHGAIVVGFPPVIARHNVVMGNSIHHNTRGIDVLDAASTFVLANQLSQNENGISMHETSGDRVLGNVVIGQGNDAFGSFGILMAFTVGADVRFNTIRSHATALQIAGATNSRIEKNRIRDNFYYGVVLAGAIPGATGNIIAGNVSDSSGLAGLSADNASTGNTFRRNHAHGNGYNGALLQLPAADVMDDDHNRWINNSCDTAVGNAACRR